MKRFRGTAPPSQIVAERFGRPGRPIAQPGELQMWGRTWLVGVAAVAVGCASAAPVDAHPSDFRTLTVDLVVGDGGLETVDAALVPADGQTFEPFPSVDARRAVASRVIAALALPADGATVDAENSERYHEVGFTIRVDARVGAAWDGRVDTAPFQQIVADEGLDRLKLSVCEAGVVIPGVAPDLTVVATRPGRTGVSPNDREGCTTWALGAHEDPVTIAVGGPTTLAATGTGPLALVLGASALVLGVLLIMVGQDGRRGGGGRRR
jgi:hypothetical protein